MFSGHEQVEVKEELVERRKDPAVSLQPGELGAGGRPAHRRTELLLHQLLQAWSSARGSSVPWGHVAGSCKGISPPQTHTFKNLLSKL